MPLRYQLNRSNSTLLFLAVDNFTVFNRKANIFRYFLNLFPVSNEQRNNYTLVVSFHNSPQNHLIVSSSNSYPFLLFLCLNRIYNKIKLAHSFHLATFEIFQIQAAPAALKEQALPSRIPLEQQTQAQIYTRSSLCSQQIPYYVLFHL